MMTYEQLSNEVDTLLENTEKKMSDLIEKFNSSNKDMTVDEVDLSYKFNELKDYVEDYVIVEEEDEDEDEDETSAIV